LPPRLGSDRGLTNTQAVGYDFRIRNKQKRKEVFLWLWEIWVSGSAMLW
jgi:hypothetical protein